jgi:ketosteroid isomerase-like protein
MNVATRLAQALLACVLPLAAGCAGAPAAPTARAPADAVLAADLAFAAYAKAHGTEAAFVEYATADAVLFVAGVGPVRGPAAIGRVYASGPKILLEWTPEFAEVAASGDLAWSWGYGRWTVQDGSGKTGTTNYVTVWRRQADGRWKWAADLGVPGPAKAAPK